MPDALLDHDRLNVLRREVRRLFDQGGGLEDLDIDRFDPPEGTTFAIVSPTPKLHGYVRGDNSNWRRCSYCERDRQFVDGYLVYCADDKLRLLGMDCWRRHFDEQDWAAAKEGYRDFDRRERFEQLMQQLRPASKAVQYLLRGRDDWLPALEYAEGFAEQVEERLPDLFQALAKVAVNDGQATIEKWVLNVGSLEGRRGQVTAQEKSDGKAERVLQPVPVARINGLLALKKRSIRGIPDKAFKAICEANRLLEDTPWADLTDRAFREKERDYRELCQEAIRLLDVLHDRLQEIRLFLSPQNVQAICRWAGDNDNELSLWTNYSPVKGGLKVLPQAHDAVSLILPPNLTVPQEPIDQLRRLVMA